jgi:hypothetical protein
MSANKYMDRKSMESRLEVWERKLKDNPDVGLDNIGSQKRYVEKYKQFLKEADDNELRLYLLAQMACTFVHENDHFVNRDVRFDEDGIVDDFLRESSAISLGLELAEAIKVVWKEENKSVRLIEILEEDMRFYNSFLKNKVGHNRHVREGFLAEYICLR